MKDCKKIHPLLSLYAEGELTPAEKARVDQHLRVCADAREELEKQKSLRKALAALPEPDPPHDLHGKIMARVTGKAQPLREPGRFWTWAPWSLAAAAVLMVVILHPFSPGEKKMVVAGLPKNLEEKVSANRMDQTLTGTNSLKGQAQFDKDSAAHMNGYEATSNANSGPGISDGTRDDLSGKQLAFAPESKVEKRSKKKARDMEVAFAKPMGNAESSGIPAPAAPAPKPEAGVVELQTKSASAPSENLLSATDLAIKKEAPPEASAARAFIPPAPNPTEGAVRSVRFSREITASTWTGGNAPVTEESAVLVTDAVTFKQDWQQLRPGETAPDVDFATQAVVFLTAGVEPSAGYSIHLSNLEEKTDQLVIHYKVETPAPGALEAQILTHPWSMQVIPKSTKAVVFQKDS
jgi:hypothetical protein